MDNKKELIIETFNNSFNLQKFINFTQELFKGNAKYKSNIEFSPKVKGEFKDVVKEFLELGWYKDKNRKSMAIAVVRLEREDSVARSRAIQRNFVKDYFLKSGSDSALVAFYNNNSGDWRLSFIKLDYSYKEAKLEEELTPAKRFSFLLGENEKHHTAIGRFLPLINNDKEAPTIKEIEEAFNIEVVTKEFFERYCDLYLEIKKCLDNQDGFNKIAKELDIRSDEFAKKLMGQLVFLYFLQKKGWLGVEANPKEITESEASGLLGNKSYDAGEAFEKVYELRDDKYIRNDNKVIELNDEETIALNSIFINTKYDANWGSGDKDFIRSLYNKAVKDGKNFYNEYLEHVFYNALNDKRGGSTYFKELNCKIPFLNGGLFQPISENYDYENSDFIIPNEIFSNKEKTKQDDIGNGVLDIFDRYAFTIKEDEPLEKEVAVDPEMLGKVFENLLDIVDRKSKGAFYTPREIVHYMCQESLINHLITEIGIEYQDAETLIRYGDILADIDSSKKAFETGNFKMPSEVRKNAEKIDYALSNVKVADPAVGSGAFPLGMLNEIVRARMNLTQYMVDDIDAIHRGYTNVKGRKPYDLKLKTIQRCIHAVDIERSAVDIAKLRLWLSLVVEENDFRNVKPLPNLDYNIMVGNSLLEEFEGVKLFNEKLLEEKNNNLSKETVIEQIDFIEGKKESEYVLDEIYNLQERFFSVNSAEEKIKLKDLIDKLEWTLIEKNVKENGKEELLPKIREFKRTNTKPYFLWKLNFAKVFREKGGFDIVIGNPPYLRVQGIKEASPELVDKYKELYKSATGSYDLYVLFVEKGLSLLNDRAILNYIMPHKWVNSSFGKGLRSIVYSGGYLKKFISFGSYQVFNASTYTSLLWLSKKENKTSNYYEFQKDFVDNSELEKALNSLKDSEYTKIEKEKLKSDVWVLTNNTVSNIINKLEKHSFKLKDIFQKIFVGLQTSKDSVYFLKDCTENGDLIEGFSEELSKRVQVEKGIVKRLLKGDQVHKYETLHTDNYVIFPYYILNEKGKDIAKLYTENEIKEKFDKGYEYLKECEEILKNRERGKLKNDEYWYRYIYPKNLTLFDNQKLVAPDISLGGNFSIDCNGEFAQTTTIYGYIKKKEFKESYNFYMSILNSNLLWFYLQNTGNAMANGYFRYKPAYLNEFPIPSITNIEDTKPFEVLVDYIMWLKNKINPQVAEGVTNQYIAGEFEKVLNGMVYELYFKDDMKNNNIEFIKYGKQGYLPIENLKDLDKIKVIYDSYKQLNEEENTIRNNLVSLPKKLGDLILPIENSLK